MKIFGITGTNGKTTTSYMLDCILRDKGFKCDLVGTVGHRIGGSLYEAVNTTPGRTVFKDYMKKASEYGTDMFITEVSSHALVQERLRDVPVEYAAFTNLSQDHMDYHNDIEDYYAAKKKLFGFSSIKAAIINIDDRYGGRLAEELREERRDISIITVSLKDSEADICADIKNEDFAGTAFGAKIHGSAEEIYSIPVPGKYNVYNAVTAAGLSYAATGIKDASYHFSPLAVFGGTPGRFEIIRNDNGGKTAICDYAHTPDALYNLLSTVNDIREKDGYYSNGMIITVFGCGGDRDKSKRQEMGRVAGSLSDFTVITSDNPRSEDPDKIINDIEKGIRTVTGEYIKEPDRRKAIEKAMAVSSPGDIIVVAGKGHETYQMTDMGKKDFDDRKVIRELL